MRQSTYGNRFYDFTIDAFLFEIIQFGYGYDSIVEASAFDLSSEASRLPNDLIRSMAASWVSNSLPETKILQKRFTYSSNVNLFLPRTSLVARTVKTGTSACGPELAEAGQRALA